MFILNFLYTTLISEIYTTIVTTFWKEKLFCRTLPLREMHGLLFKELWNCSHEIGIQIGGKLVFMPVN